MAFVPVQKRKMLAVTPVKKLISFLLNPFIGFKGSIFALETTNCAKIAVKMTQMKIISTLGNRIVRAPG